MEVVLKLVCLGLVVQLLPILELVQTVLLQQEVSLEVMQE